MEAELWRSLLLGTGRSLAEPGERAGRPPGRIVPLRRGRGLALNEGGAKVRTSLGVWLVECSSWAP